MNLLFWYQFFCGFSGTAMIDYWLMIFFNLFFTSAPPIMFGIMDKDLSAEMLLGVPELYRTGQGAGVSDRDSKTIELLFIGRKQLRVPMIDMISLCIFVNLNLCGFFLGIQVFNFLDFHTRRLLSEPGVLLCSILGKRNMKPPSLITHCAKLHFFMVCPLSNQLFYWFTKSA